MCSYKQVFSSRWGFVAIRESVSSSFVFGDVGVGAGDNKLTFDLLVLNDRTSSG